MQRKEGRRLNLHQNVWLPVLGKGRGSGGGWKGEKLGKLHCQIGKWGKDRDFPQDPGLSMRSSNKAPLRHFPPNQLSTFRESFPRIESGSTRHPILTSSEQTRQEQECVPKFRYSENGQLRWKLWKLGLSSTPDNKIPGDSSAVLTFGNR